MFESWAVAMVHGSSHPYQPDSATGPCSTRQPPGAVWIPDRGRRTIHCETDRVKRLHPACSRPPEVQASGERSEDLVVLGETVLLALREDELAVDAHVELTRLAGEQVDLDALRLLDRGRETRGLGLVVSDHAVLD